MLRAAYMAQEFLFTFSDHVEAVSLKPGSVNGIFNISINEKIIFDRKENGGFLEIKALKQLIRNEIVPGMSLGHSDGK